MHDFAKLSHCHLHSASRTIKTRSETLEHVFILLSTHIIFILMYIYANLTQISRFYMPEYCISHRNTNFTFAFIHSKNYSGVY